MPLMRTTTVEDVRNHWASLCGLDQTAITGTDDATLFIDFLNEAFTTAWLAAEWPFAVKSASFATDADGKIDLSANSEVRDILDVYDGDPFTDSTADVLIAFVNQNDVYVPSAVSGTVYLYYRTQETDYDGTLSETVPYQFRNYLAFQASSLWLAGEGQEAKSIARENRANVHLDNEIDDIERQQQQTLPSRVGVRTVGVR